MLLLILGCQRSGTTLLASMLGRHSEINMLFESTSKDIFKLLGKKYQANKLCVWRQIRMKDRASKWGHLVNRLVNFHFRKSKYHNIRIYPTSQLSIQDYLDKGAKIIVIRRDEESVLNSLLNRTPLNERQARREIKLASKILNEIKDQVVEVTFFDLVNNPKEVMIDLCKKLNLEFEERMLQGPEYNIIYPNKGFISEKAADITHLSPPNK